LEGHELTAAPPGDAGLVLAVPRRVDADNERSLLGPQLAVPRRQDQGRRNPGLVPDRDEGLRGRRWVFLAEARGVAGEVVDGFRPAPGQLRRGKIEGAGVLELLVAPLEGPARIPDVFLLPEPGDEHCPVVALATLSRLPGPVEPIAHAVGGRLQ